MIKEMFEYCLTPASFRARRTGYLHEAVAFESRARRNEKYWRPHWKICQNLVENFCLQNPSAKSLAIFGSGCLFEVPQNFLASRFEHLMLIDQVFPRSLRSWVRKQKIQIDLVESDLTENFPRHLKADLALSANLLSQLSLPQPEKRVDFQNQHLNDLKSLSCPILLWTDHEKVFKRKNTNEVLHREPTVSVPFPNSIEKWIWNLAPAPEIDSEVDLVLEMTASVF